VLILNQRFLNNYSQLKISVKDSIDHFFKEIIKKFNLKKLLMIKNNLKINSINKFKKEMDIKSKIAEDNLCIK